MTSQASGGVLGAAAAARSHSGPQPRPAPAVAAVPDVSSPDHSPAVDPSGRTSQELGAEPGQENELEELAIMADRERIAFDLHDLVIQRLFAAGLVLKSTADIALDPQIASRLDHVIDEIDTTIVDIRATIFALGHRYKSTSGDLRSHILDLVGDAAGTLGHHPNVRFRGPIATDVPDVVAEHLLAVLREALSNVARHAHATRTIVDLSVATNVVLQVTDNGVGTAGSSPVSGLRNMARRAESLGGGTELTSPGGGGTRVKWWVPVRRSRTSGGAY